WTWHSSPPACCCWRWPTGCGRCGRPLAQGSPPCPPICRPRAATAWEPEMTELLLCLAGWCAMALGMDRHHEDALRRSATAPTLRRLRGAGWVLLAAALAHAVGR